MKISLNLFSKVIQLLVSNSCLFRSLIAFNCCSVLDLWCFYSEFYATPIPLINSFFLFCKKKWE